MVSFVGVLAIYFATTRDSRPGAAIVESQTFQFWLSVLVTLIASTSGIVFTYSLVSYLRDKRLANLILVLLTANLVLVIFLLFMTHPALADWSPFSDRDKARTLIAELGWTLALGVFVIAFYGNSPTTRKRKDLAIAVGVVAAPASSFLFLLSPTPVFYTVTPGTDEVTILGWFLTFVDLVFAAVTVVRFAMNWYRERWRFDLAFLLTLILWIVALVIYNRQMETYEFSGLLWIGSLLAGFILLDVAMIVSAVFETHKELEDLIAERTRQLQLSREESDFYLHMWSHEIGNVLQGIVTYLELMAEHGDPDRTLSRAAMDLAAKTTLIIRQVGKLAQVKEAQEQQVKPVDLSSAITEATDTVHGILGAQTFTVEATSKDKGLLVIADNLLELVFVNLIVQCVRHSNEKETLVNIDATASSEYVTVVCSSAGTHLSQTIEQSLTEEIVPAATALGLDLFTVKLLAGRYGARVKYGHDADPERNVFTLTFRRG